LALLAGFAAIGGCASVFEGTTQQISVTTNPAAARCTFWRNGNLIADIGATPGAVTIDKSRADLVIVCDKPGYSPATYVNRSGLSGMAFANILTAGLAWAYDSSRGADNKYEGSVNLSLSPMTQPNPVTALPVSPTPAPAAGAPVRPRTPSPPAPPAPTAAPSVPVAAPAAPQVDCTAADGSRIRVTGNACPPGWAAR
jgi:hypothetical protein